jgi:hypothetical protein
VAGTSLQEALEAKREKYDEEGTWLRFLLEAFLGCGGFQGRIKQPPAGWWGSAAEAYSNFATATLREAPALDHHTYLDRHVREDSEKFTRRIAVSHYLNYVRPTTLLKSSYIVRKPHTRLNVPPKLQKWITDSKYDTDFRKRVLSAAVLGWFPVMVNKPKGNPDALNASQAGNMDPYVVQMLPCTLLDYETDEQGKFLWVKTCTTMCRRAAFDAPRVTVKRYEVWTRADFRVWEISDTDGQLSEPVPVDQGTHDFGHVPCVSWRAETSIEDPVKADSINADIAVEARRLFNLISEFDEHIRGQAFALLVLPRREVAAPGQGVLGVENGLIIDPEQKNVPFYLAPPGDLAATFEMRIERSIIEIYRMARVEYDRASGTRSSAQSKEQNFEQTNLSIADFASALARADRETLILVGRGLGISQDQLEKIECVPEKDFATKELNEELEAVVEALKLAMGVTFKVELLRRLNARLLPNLAPETLKKIDREIEESVGKAETDAELARAALLATDTGDDNNKPPPDDDDDDEQRKAA